MTESEHRVVHTIAAVGGPVGGLSHTRVAIHQMLVFEERLTVTVDIGLEEVVGRQEVTFAQMVGAAEEEVRTIAKQALGVVLAIVGIHPTLFVGQSIDGVKTLCDGEDATVEGEEFQRVDVLMFVHPFVEFLVLFLHSLQQEVVDAGILLVDGVLQKLGHQLFCLVEVTAAAQIILRLGHLTLLGKGRRSEKVER